MAAPKWHALATTPIAIVSTVAYPLTTPENIIVLAGVVGLGIFTDGDHLSIRRVKKILRKEKGPVPGWINWGHTWLFCVAVVLVSIFVWSILPFVSYTVHMLIDGGDRSNVEKYPGVAPLPEFLHRFYPEWAKYETGLII